MASRTSKARDEFLALAAALEKGLAGKVEVTISGVDKARSELAALRAELEATQGVLGKLSGSLGGLGGGTGGAPANAPAFSSATDHDFKRSRWEKPPPMPRAPGAGRGPGGGAGGTGGGEGGGSGGGSGAPKDLKYLLRQIGIGRAAQAAISVAGGLELTKLALGYRGMAQLQALEMRATMQARQLFRGVDSSPLIRATDRFFQLVNVATPAGKALSSMLTDGFNGFFKAIERVEPYVSAFVKGVIIGALDVEAAWLDLELALIPVTERIRAIDTGQIDKIGLAAAIASAPFKLLAGYVETLASGLTIAGDAAERLNKALGGVPGAVLAKLPDAARGVGKAYSAIGSAAAAPIADTIAMFKGGEPPSAAPPAATATADAHGVNTGAVYAQGLVKGMDAGIPMVRAAGERLGGAGDVGVRTGANAHSPSEKTKATGRDMGAGVVIGVDESAGAVQAAAERSLVPKLPSSSAGGTAAAAGASSGPSRVDVHVHHYWPPGVEAAKRRDVEDAGEAGTARALRSWASQMGVPLGLA